MKAIALWIILLSQDGTVVQMHQYQGGFFYGDAGQDACMSEGESIAITQMEKFKDEGWLGSVGYICAPKLMVEDANALEGEFDV